MFVEFNAGVTGRYKDSSELMKRARKAGITMDAVAYNTMIKANLKSGQLMNLHGEGLDSVL